MLRKPISAPRCFGSAATSSKRSRAGLEQQRNRIFLFCQIKRHQCMRDAEDEMKVAHREQFLLPRARSHFSRALVWHFGQWRFRQEL